MNEESSDPLERDIRNFIETLGYKWEEARSVEILPHKLTVSYFENGNKSIVITRAISF